MLDETTRSEKFGTIDDSDEDSNSAKNEAIYVGLQRELVGSLRFECRDNRPNEYEYTLRL